MPKTLTRQDIQRDILRLLRNNGHRSYRPKDIARELGIRDNTAYRMFCDVLFEMEEGGVVTRGRGGKFAFKPQPTRMEGTLRMNRQGFGFVEIPGQTEDIYIRESHLGTALDGDRVQVGLAAPAQGDKRREGEILKVLERYRKQAVGTFKQVGHFAYVVPDDKRLTQDIYVPEAGFNGAREGDKVLVSIDRFEDRMASPEGRILEILGASSDPAVRVLSLAMSLDVRSGFSNEVIAETERIPDGIPAAEQERRLDLRAKRIFTIDPVDAKDFDDAVHIEQLENGNFELGVHIADVSAYVVPDSAIDKEAYDRGTSVYLVDRVIPMLPEKLSNRVCSLRPNEDKLTYSCIMEVTPKGRVVQYDITETIIRSGYRFSYEEAQEVIEGKIPDHPFAAEIKQSFSLSSVLIKKRAREGSVDFDLPEVKVLLDDAGNPVRVFRKDRTDATRLIEEFMLLANRSVSEAIGKRKQAPPFVYRIHDRPDPEKIQKLSEYIRAFGHRLVLKEGNIDSKQLNTLLQTIKGTPEEPVIEEAALRSMAKARYSSKNIGHYGLNFAHYTHFTSPIRRYPDLMAHRLLKRYLAGGQPIDGEKLESQCEHCSGRERVAIEAEWESVRLKQVEYVQKHLGEQYEGVVSGVTKFGVYVELNDILVEGMVHVRDMDDDYYEYDERSYRLVGQYTGKTYRLGDRVEVVVAAANVDTREVDLVWANASEEVGRKKPIAPGAAQVRGKSSPSRSQGSKRSAAGGSKAKSSRSVRKR